MTSASPSRELAFLTLKAWEKDQEAHLDALLCQTAKNLEISPRDRSLAYALLLGVVRNRTFLWHQAERNLDKNAPPLPLEVRLILELALYERLFQTRTAAYAITSEAVTLCQKYALNFAPLVNAILRNQERRLEAGLDPFKEPMNIQIRYSHPGRLLSLLRQEIEDPKQLEAVLKWHNAPPKQYARLRTEEILEGLEPVPCVPKAVYCQKPRETLKSEAHQKGQIYFMQLWSQETIQKAPLKPGAKVIDLCAAPGGKSLALLDKEPSIDLTVCDISAKRLETLKENFARLGYTESQNPNIRFQELDARKAKEAFPGKAFDLVILDAPCSSLGTIQRNPELRWRFRPRELDSYAALQKEILDSALPLIKPQGHLLYSVCSFAKKERQAVKDLLSENPGFQLLEEKLTLPGEGNLFDGGYFALLQRM